MPGYNNRAVRSQPPDDFEDDENPVYRPTGTLPPYRVAGSGGSITSRSTESLPPSPLPRRTTRPALSQETAPVPERTRRVNVPEAALPTAEPQLRPRRSAAQPEWFSKLSMRWGVAAVLVIVVLLVSYLVVSTLLTGWQNWQDDQTYGWPRLTRLEAKVGHNETGPNSKTLFLAQNLKGQISIIEIPGSDPSKTRVIIGPQLFGKDRELVPVKLNVQDVNGDGQPDLIATVQEQRLIYINENGNFRPINDQERAKLKAES